MVAAAPTWEQLGASGGNPAGPEPEPAILSISDGNVADAPVPPEESRLMAFTPTKSAAQRGRSPAPRERIRPKAKAAPPAHLLAKPPPEIFRASTPVYFISGE